jgi:two-component system chemotaxis response regulator CheY
MPICVLIVDDSPLMRSVVRRVMKLAGFGSEQVLEAANGREALRQLEGNTVDVILTDINMPVMDGEALLQELSRRGTLQETPALVISTDATRDRVHRMLALGARGYVIKPFTPETLKAEIERVLGAKYDVQP